jgi:hypothetical protein
MFNTPIPERVAVIRSLYNRLAPGQEIKVVAMLLDQESLDYFLSGINSGYTHGYRIPGARPDDFKYWVLFKLNTSLENDPQNRRSYVDPDRRHHYTYEEFTGIYTPKPNSINKTSELPNTESPISQPRIRDLPKEERESFSEFLWGQTRPLINGIPDDEQDGYYPSDYDNWKRKPEHQFFD